MPTIDRQVAASTDDCWFFWNGAAWVIDTTVVNQAVGYLDVSHQRLGGGMRFLNMTIPVGATITTAYLVIQARVGNAANDVNTVVIGQDDDNPITFSSEADYQARRGTIVGGADNTHITTASVNWGPIAAWTGGVTYNSPEIKTIIQEIVNRGGWASGNAMVMFWDDHNDLSTHTDGTWRAGRTFDHDPTMGVVLHVEYTAPSANKPFGANASKLVAAGML